MPNTVITLIYWICIFFIISCKFWVLIPHL